MHFNGANSLAYNRVLSAWLNIYEIWSYSCAPRGVGIYRVTEGWGAMTNYPGADFDQSVKAWASFAMGYSAACPAGNASFNVTEFVDLWSKFPNLNFGLVAAVDPGSENDNYAWKKFASFDNNVSTDPYIRATYTPYNASYECVSPCQWTTNVTPSSYGSLPIKVKNTGKDTWPAGGAYRLSYHVMGTDGSTVQWDGARTFLPEDVPPGDDIVLQAAVSPLAAGSYQLHFDMVHEGNAWYSNESVPKLIVPVTVYNPQPTIHAVAPLGNISSGTLTPTLAVSATNNNPSYGGLSYQYKICADPAMSVSCETATSAGATWTVPSGKLEWARTYYWNIRVADGAGLSTTTTPIPLRTVPTQPTTSLHLGADPNSSSLGGVSPANGNFATTITDVAPATAGPLLSLTRTYNAQDPRVLPFGVGWSTSFDMRADGDPDGSIVISYPDGHQTRFGRNPNGSYAAAPGNGSTLTGTLAAGLTLTEAGGIRYTFASNGRLTQTANADGLALSVAYDANGRLASVTAASGRKLTFTWNAAGTHVSEVATDAVPANGNLPYKWQYTYTGDLLTQVCNPMVTGPRCTSYSYQPVTSPKTATPYAKAVLADGPKAYWRMDDTGTSMADSSGNSLNGAYAGSGVTKSQSGGIPNDPNTAVTLNGSGGYATAPSGFADFTRGLTMEAWVYPTASGWYGRIADFGNGEANDNIVFHRMGSSTDLGLSVLRGSNSQFISALNVLQLNTWQHVAATVNASGVATIYRNGQPIATGAVHLPNNINRTANYIGKSNWPSDPTWAGKVDEVAVYDRALTGESIAAHYAQAQGPVRPTTASLLSTITLPRGNVSQTVHYATDQTVDYRKDGSLKQWNFASSIAADTAARTTTVTDPAGRATVWRTNRHGSLVERVDELGNSRRFSYDQSVNAVNRLVDENGHVVSMTYDYRGNVLTRTTSQSSAYANNVVAVNPYGYWRLGEANGTSAKDSSGQGRHGTYAGGYSLAQVGGLGELDTAASFDGATGQVNLPSGFADFTGGLTMEAWVYPSANSNYARIFDLGNGQENDNVILHRVGTTNDLGISILRGTSSQFLGAPNVLQANTWQHVAVTVTSAGTATIYRNGQVVASGTVHLPNNVNRTSNFIGKSNWPNDARWQGLIDEAAVFPAALSASNIAARYALGLSTGGQTTSYDYFSPYANEVMADNPKAYWRLGDRTGTQLYDYSEHGYTATKNGAVSLGAPGGMPMDGDSAATFSGAAGTNATANVSLPQNGVTLEAWVNLPDTSRYGAFVQVGTGSDGYGLGVGNAGYYEGEAGNHLIGLYENQRWINSGVDIGTGWHHVAMTIAANGTATFFKDGVEVFASPGPLPHQPLGTELSIGGYSPGGPSRWFNGGVDEVAIYTTALSVDDIRAHYLAGASTAGTDPRLGKMIATRDARSTWRYDNAYRTTYGHNAAGHQTSKTPPVTSDAPLPRPTTWTYTTAGEPEGYQGALQPAGLLKSVTTPGATTSFLYDSKGDMRQATDPVGLVSTVSYDVLGRKTSAVEASDTYPAGLTTTWEYDELSRVKSSTAPPTTNSVTNVVHTLKTTYIYDANGNVTDATMSDATGGDSPRHTSFTYDDSDRLLTSTNAATETMTRTYDDVGNLATETDARGTVTRFAYTPRGQLATRTIQNFIDDPVAPGTPRNIVLESRAYDPGGRLASMTDVLGRTTEFAYFDDDLVHKATLKGYREANGTTRDVVLEEFTYDAAGNIVKTIKNGSTAVLASYDAAGRITSTTLDPTGLNRVTAFAYDANDRLVQTALSGDSRTETKTQGYDAAGRVVTQTTVNDATADLTTLITRDKRGVVKSIRDPRQNTTTFTSDAGGRTTAITQPSVAYESGNGGTPANGSPQTYIGFNTFGDQTHLKNPISATTTMAYDGLGRVTDVTYPTYTPVAGTTVTPAEHYTYDGNSNVVTFVDRRGQTTSTTYDKLNRVVQVTDPKLAAQPASGKSRFVYDDAGNVISATDVVGAVVQNTYDDRNRVRTRTVVERVPAPTASYTTTYSYDDSGNVLTETDPLTFVTTMTYNAAGEVTTVKSPRGFTTTITRDVAGRAINVRDPLSRRTKSTYDLAGRLTKLEHFDRNYVSMGATRFGNDAAGNPTSMISPLGWTTTQAFDALNRRTSITEPISATDSMTTSFGYDRAGNRTRVTNGRGVSTYTKYQSWSLPKEVVEQAGAWSRTYNGSGQVATSTTPDGVVRTRTYDELGRLTQESSAGGGAPIASRTLGYDLRDLKSVSHPSGTQTFTYNDRGLMTASSGPSGNVSFLYNANGDRTRRVDAAGTSNFAYDRNRNLSWASDPATGVTANFNYDVADQVTGVTNGAGNATRAYTYDDRGRLLTDTLTSGAGSPMASVAYGYDLDSNVTSKTVGPAAFAGAGTNTYTYDRASRLTSWTNPANVATTYGWDKAGNRTSAGSTTFVYDNDNRLTSEAVGGVTTATYSYTPRGTLASKTGSGAGAFTFDGFDRLVADGSRAYTYDGLDRLATAGGTAFTYAGAEKEPTGDGTATFARGPNGALVSMSKGGVGTRLFTDGHGDVVGNYTPSGAAMTDSRAYDPWGAQTASVGTTNPTVGYQGSWTDPATGKVSMQARFYTPGMGTFASRDAFDVAITSSATANRYAYGAANPLKYVDPTGQYIEGYKIQHQAALAGTLVLAGGVAATAAMAVPVAQAALAGGGAYGVPLAPQLSQVGSGIMGGLSKAFAFGASAIGAGVAGAKVAGAYAVGAVATVGTAATATIFVGANVLVQAPGWSGPTYQEWAVPNTSAFSAMPTLAILQAAAAASWSELDGFHLGLPTVEDIAKAMGQVTKVTKRSSNSRDAVTFELRGSNTPISMFPSINPFARVIHSVATLPPPDVWAQAAVAAVSAEAIWTSAELEVGLGGGPEGPGNNRCEVEPDGGLQSCVPITPDDDHIEDLKELALQLLAGGAGAMKGGGRGSGGGGRGGGDDRIFFGQESVSNRFTTKERRSDFKYAGWLISDVASGLRNNQISPDELPIQYIVRDGVKIAINNRSLLALRRAGLEPTVTIDVTGNRKLENRLSDRLEEMNGTPSDTIRVRGSEHPRSSFLDWLT